ncbi:MAG: hypothetical protein M9890_11790, partial [Thermomicrobiales bacterium]|nr:hypothetical protein [Thermomicrobiales bacterium]
TISFDDPELCPRIIDWVWILRHWKGPRPPKGDDTIGVHEYLVAAVQFQNAADAFVDRASGRMFGMVADQLFEAAARIE